MLQLAGRGCGASAGFRALVATTVGGGQHLRSVPAFQRVLSVTDFLYDWNDEPYAL